jgi:hypothetical protein
MAASPIAATRIAAASPMAASPMAASPIAASCVTGQWVYEKDDHCENKNSAGNFLHIFPPCLILQMCFKSLYSTFQCVSMNNKQELHLKEESNVRIRYQSIYSNYTFF